MKLGWDLRNGLERRITAWKSEDPSRGDLSWGTVLNNYPEFYLMNGTEKYCRIGPWNGLHFSGLSDQEPNSIYDFKFVTSNDFNYVSNKDEMFYSFTLKNTSVFMTSTISRMSFITFILLDENNSVWRFYASIPEDNCGKYGICGPYTKCIITETPRCQCLEGLPKSPQAWNSFDWSLKDVSVTDH
ncbi:S-locus glycoprotein domain [Sesbania bispinosa]|nr:S-locus glycoprotein domain [Sesbania bispinosa]